jgi:hypothetical protein
MFRDERSAVTLNASKIEPGRLLMPKKHSDTRFTLARVIQFTLLGSLLSLSACQRESAPEKAAAQGVLHYPVSKLEMRVNGEGVDTELVLAAARERRLNITDPAQLDQARRIVADYLVLAQAAHNSGFSQKPEYVVRQIRNVASDYVDSIAQSIQPSEQELQAEYQRQVEIIGGRELRLQIMTFNSLEFARSVQREHMSGRTLITLMSTYAASKEVVKAETHEWVNLAQFPPALQEAIKGLQVGQGTPDLVADNGIWHLAEIVEQRPFAPPPFVDVRDGIQKTLVQIKTDAQVKAILSQAKISQP